MTSTATRLRFASALSLRDDGGALDEIVASIQPRLGGAADVLVVFATMHYGPRLSTLCSALREALGAATLLACTCGGVIGTQREIEDGPALSVLAGTLPGVVIEPFSYDEMDWVGVLSNPAALHASLPRSIASGDARAVIMLADPFSTPMARLLPAFNAALPGVPVIGGMASGATAAGANRLILGDRVFRSGAIGVALAGGVDVQTTVSQGCRPVGRPYVITRSKRHVVQQLGGRKALEVVQEMAAALPHEERMLVQEAGLFVGRVIDEYKPRFGRGDFLVRNLVGVDEEQGYIAIADPQVRVGQTIQFHVRDGKIAEEDLRMMLQAQRVHGPAEGALLFSCNSRGTRLFDHASADAAMVHEALPDTPLAGFFAAGEIGPVGGQNYLHGHTASLAVFRPLAQG